MSCGGRVYKGDLVMVSIPFDVSGYTELTVSYFTIGDFKIVRTESELTIEDGYIISYFEGDDLDILPDGVIRYTINYSVDNTDYMESTNTMLYLKTPMGYSAITAEEIYQEGYERGQEECPECSGTTDCSSAVTEAFESGYTEGYSGGYTEGYSSGYTQGQADCPECSGGICTNIQQQKIVYFNTRPGAGEATIYPDSGYDGVYEAVANIDGALYEASQEGYNNGYTDGKKDCRVWMSAVTEAEYEMLPYQYVDTLINDGGYRSDLEVTLDGTYNPNFFDEPISAGTHTFYVETKKPSRSPIIFFPRLPYGTRTSYCKNIGTGIVL